jgi:hypothetical protein
LAALAGILLAATPVSATHFRYGHLTWVPRPDIGPTAIDFTLQSVWRRTTFSTANGRCKDPATLAAIACTGAGGFAGVGDLVWEDQGDTRLDPGDGSGLIGGPGALSGSLLYLVTAVDEVNNWVFGVAVDPANVANVDTAITHVFPGPGTFTAVVDDCCRISPCVAPTAHMNNPDDGFRVATPVTVGTGNSSPVSALPPIILCPVSGACAFTVPASDNELDPLIFRLSTPTEAAFTTQPGPPQCPSAAAIDAATGVYTWNTAGCRTAASPLPAPPDGGCNRSDYNTCYSTQVTIEEDAVGGSRAALDFLICLVACPPSNQAPVFDAPTPTCGSTVAANPGASVSFTVRASDGDTVESATLNVAGLPGDATMTPTLPTAGNPATSVLSWMPSANDLGQHVLTFTATDQCGAQTLCSLTIDVSQEECADGVDNDHDGFADCADPDCDGTTCEDGQFCTVNDTCQAGQCVGAARRCDDAQPCTVDRCDETTNACVFDPRPSSGTTCDTDGTLCTVERCGAGRCNQIGTVTCQSAAPPCEAGAACSPATGACVAGTDAPAGATCNADGNLCTLDACDGAGVCRQVEAVSCQPPAPPCEAGAACNPATGACVAGTDAPAGTTCNADGSLCTIDACDGAGVCRQVGAVGCQPPALPCEGGAACNPTTGACATLADASAGTACDTDADRCTVDACDGGGACARVDVIACQPPDSVCDGGETCNPGTGTCLPAPAAPAGLACDLDGDLCTLATCDGAGACVATGAVTCGSADPPCKSGEFCDPETGGCVGLPDAPEGEPCDTDGDATLDGRCDGGGECSSGPPLALCENLLGSFKGYNLRSRSGFETLDVALTDQFGTGTMTVLRPKYLSNPATVDGVLAPDPTAHMTCYRIRDVAGQAKFQQVDVEVESRFGREAVTAVRAETLCVPAAKDLVPVTSRIDRFKCYRMKAQVGTSRFERGEATIDDQFESKGMLAKRLLLLCNPVDRDGDEILNPLCHMACYKIADLPGQAPFAQRAAIVEDEFGEQNVGTGTKVREFCSKSAVLCVPALKTHQ